MIVVSFIIIAKNEEKKIEQCIKSIIDLNLSFKHEIILVDSNSCDKTIEIASKYDISIIKLDENWHHSVAMGRFVGYKMCKGKYVLFIDADMTIEKETNFEKALKHFKEEPKLIAISGKLKEYVRDENENLIRSSNDVYNVTKFEQRDDLGGVSLFNRELLEKIGGIDVSLDTNEDVELKYRVDINGYKFYRTPNLRFIHNSKETYNIGVINSRYKSGRYKDIWTVLFKSIKYGKFKENIRTNSFVYFWSIYLTSLLVLMLVGIVFDSKVRTEMILGEVFLAIILILYKIIKKGFKNAILDFYYATIATFSIFQNIYWPKVEYNLDKVLIIKE